LRRVPARFAERIAPGRGGTARGPRKKPGAGGCRYGFFSSWNLFQLEKKPSLQGSAVIFGPHQKKIVTFFAKSEKRANFFL